MMPPLTPPPIVPFCRMMPPGVMVPAFERKPEKLVLVTEMQDRVAWTGLVNPRPTARQANAGVAPEPTINATTELAASRRPFNRDRCRAITSPTHACIDNHNQPSVAARLASINN